MNQASRATAIAAPGDHSMQTPDVSDASASMDEAGNSFAWARVRRSMRTGARFGVGAAMGLWLADAAVNAPARTVDAKRWLTGVGAALFVALTTSLVAGALMGPIFVPIATSLAERVRGWWRWLRHMEGHASRSVVGRALGGAWLLCMWSWFAYWVSLATEFGFADAKSMAGALTLSHWVFATTLAIAWPLGMRLGEVLVDGASRLPGLRWLIARAWRVSCLLTATALLATAAEIVAHRRELPVLPWRNVFAFLGVVPGLWTAGYLPHARPRWGVRPARVALALVVLGLAGGAAAAARLRPESTTARRLAFDRMWSGRLGYAIWTAVFDFDRDGQLGMLGGGDCAPFDARRYTGARDIPGNGIDEDCDGTDLPRLVIHARPRMQVGQDTLPLRPTIILITIDALAATRLAALRGGTSSMPHLNDLAKGAMLFTHCFAQGPSTRLSFPSIFTSRWDSQLTHLFMPAHPYPLAPFERQLQDLLNDAGYETVAVLPNAYFDASHWSSVTRGFQRVDTSAIPAGKHNAPQVTDATLRILSAAQHRPLYLWVHYYDAHGPYQPLRGVVYDRPTEEALYDAELGYIDRELGRLLAALDARPEPAYIFLTADHATVFHPDPSSRRGHYGYDLYTATLHVPLLVRGPGIPGGRVDGIVSTMDIAPTIADLLRLSSAGFEGTSLLPEMLAAKHDPDRLLFHEFYLPERAFRGEDPLQMVSVRTSRYNLVLDRALGSYELYDWTEDYFEQRDLYEDQARSPEALHLRSLVSSFVQQFHVWTPGADRVPQSSNKR